MATDIGARMTLAGEKEFRQALSQINAGLKVTASELTLLSAKYSDNDKSVKALTERNTLLEKQMTEQRTKVEKIREALAKATKVYGDADKNTLKWKESLNTAEAELIQVEKELKDNSEALKQATANMEKYGLKEDEVAEQSRSLGSVLSDIIGKLGIQLPAGVDKAVQALDSQTASTMALIGVTVGLVSGFAKTTIETAKYADEVLTLSKTTGLTTDTIQEMQYASKFIDVSVETMTGAMTKMIRNMDNARKGTGDAADAFRELHLRITEGNGQLKDSEKMFYEVIDALGRMTNETERDATAMAIFGKSAQELNPLIEAGSSALKEYAEQAHNIGYVLDNNTLNSFGNLDDVMEEFNKRVESFKKNIAIALLPILQTLFDWLNKINPQTIATVAIVGSIVVTVVSVVKAISGLVGMFNTFSVAGLKTTLTVIGITAALIALATIIAVIIGKGDELNRTIGNIGSSVSNMTNTVNSAGNRLNIGRNALGTSNWRGGLTWVGEEGPELVNLPAGSKVYSNKQSMRIAFAGAGGGDNYNTYNVYVQAKDLDEASKVIKVFEKLRQVSRKGVRR